MNHQKKFDFFTLVQIITLFSSYLSHATEHVPGLKVSVEDSLEISRSLCFESFLSQEFFFDFFFSQKSLKIILKSVGFFLQINVFSVVNVCLSVLDGGRRRRSGGVKSEKLRIRELSGASKKTTPHRCHKSGARHPAG